MSTSVFLSWSGELSGKLAEVLYRWLPSTLQFVKPYYSPNDIEKGARWSTEIAAKLEASDVGIVCLTPDNLHAPWLLFESGALSKHIRKSRVCALLFDVEPADVAAPLSIFQLTRFTKADFERLLITVNNSSADSQLEKAVLKSVFEKWWPDLQEQVTSTLEAHAPSAGEQLRSDRDILEEILNLTRMKSTRAPTRGQLEEALTMGIEDVIGKLELEFEMQDNLYGKTLMDRMSQAYLDLRRILGLSLLRQQAPSAPSGRSPDTGSRSGEKGGSGDDWV